MWVGRASNPCSLKKKEKARDGFVSREKVHFEFRYFNLTKSISTKGYQKKDRNPFKNLFQTHAVIISKKENKYHVGSLSLNFIG